MIGPPLSKEHSLDKRITDDDNIFDDGNLTTITQTMAISSTNEQISKEVNRNNESRLKDYYYDDLSEYVKLYENQVFSPTVFQTVEVSTATATTSEQDVSCVSRTSDGDSYSGTSGGYDLNELNNIIVEQTDLSTSDVYAICEEICTSELADDNDNGDNNNSNNNIVGDAVELNQFAAYVELTNDDYYTIDDDDDIITRSNNNNNNHNNVVRSSLDNIVTSSDDMTDYNTIGSSNNVAEVGRIEECSNVLRNKVIRRNPSKKCIIKNDASHRKTIKSKATSGGSTTSNSSVIDTSPNIGTRWSERLSKNLAAADRKRKNPNEKEDYQLDVTIAGVNSKKKSNMATDKLKLSNSTSIPTNPGVVKKSTNTGQQSRRSEDDDAKVDLKLAANYEDRDFPPDKNLSWLIDFNVSSIFNPSQNSNSKKDTRLSEASRKPRFTYTELIEQALKENGQLTVSGIYNWISSRYPYYQQNDDKWKNSVRHNLSINPQFRKGKKASQGAGHYWTINCDLSRKSTNITATTNESHLNKSSASDNAINEILEKKCPRETCLILEVMDDIDDEELLAATNSIQEYDNDLSICDVNLQQAAEHILSGAKRQVEVQYLNEYDDHFSNNSNNNNPNNNGDYLWETINEDNSTYDALSPLLRDIEAETGNCMTDEDNYLIQDIHNSICLGDEFFPDFDCSYNLTATN